MLCPLDDLILVSWNELLWKWSLKYYNFCQWRNWILFVFPLNVIIQFPFLLKSRQKTEMAVFTGVVCQIFLIMFLLDPLCCVTNSDQCVVSRKRYVMLEANPFITRLRPISFPIYLLRNDWQVIMLLFALTTVSRDFLAHQWWTCRRIKKQDIGCFKPLGFGIGYEYSITSSLTHLM